MALKGKYGTHCASDPEPQVTVNGRQQAKSPTQPHKDPSKGRSVSEKRQRGAIGWLSGAKPSNQPQKSTHGDAG